MVMSPGFGGIETQAHHPERSRGRKQNIWSRKSKPSKTNNAMISKPTPPKAGVGFFLRCSRSRILEAVKGNAAAFAPEQVVLPMIEEKLASFLSDGKIVNFTHYLQVNIQ
jgi:hypothetical protein